MDWGVGRYESTAAALQPAAERLVEVAELRPGEHVVDVGCGTGNAALLANQAGSRVTGVDPAPRLLQVARERCGEQVEFVAGEAAKLPLPDASADVLLSVFGVIFAPDPPAAAAELSRVAAPESRIVLSAWLPRGAIFDELGVIFRAVAAARGDTAAPRRFAWHEPREVSALLEPYGFAAVDVSNERLSFTAPSAGDFIAEQFNDHPMSLDARTTLDASGQTEAVREAALGVLEQANEDHSGAFCVTSEYVILTARRG